MPHPAAEVMAEVTAVMGRRARVAFGGTKRGGGIFGKGSQVGK